MKALHVVIILLLIAAFGLLQPKLSSFIPPIRAYRLQHFLSVSKQQEIINLSSLWPLRERYSPGTWEIEKSLHFATVNHDSTGEFQDWLSSACNPLLYSRYRSPFVLTETYLVNADCSWSSFSPDRQFQLHTPTDLVLEDPHEIVFATFRTVPDWIKYDGFMSFDFVDQEFRQEYESSRVASITRFLR